MTLCRVGDHSINVWHAVWQTLGHGVAHRFQPTEPVTHGDNGLCHCERSEAIQGNQQGR